MSIGATQGGVMVADNDGMAAFLSSAVI